MNYVLNKETQKIELSFDKAVYMALSDEIKKEIKSAFLWSNKSSAWVSREIRSHFRAHQVLTKLGATDCGSVGERLSYAEELDRKSERAEARADRFEEYAVNAEARAKQLQSALKHHRGDIAFFTQPIIAGHSGSRSFANYRNKLYARYDRGFEEYKKSEYYQDRAATARATAENAKLSDRVYLHNRIKECNLNMKKLQSYIVECEERLYRINKGEELKNWQGEIVTAESLESAIERYLDKYDYEQGKQEFMQDCMDKLGGVEFSKDNIKVGYMVQSSLGVCEIVGAGPQNVQLKTQHGFVITKPYADIKKIIAAKKPESIVNPYSEGDILTACRPADGSIYKAYQVIKTTATGVKLRKIAVDNGQPIRDKFINDELIQKKVTKSKFSDNIGVWLDGWQLYKYTD